MRWQGCGCLRCVAGWVTTATAMVAERAGLCSLGVYDERGLKVHGRVAITESTVLRDGAGTGEAAPDKGLRWHGDPWGISEVSVYGVTYSKGCFRPSVFSAYDRWL